eukprot:snap_masked-scaffold_5-processed-gene-13.45-mRNA-1 protein AED:1.00 eAED:1.00 QI:0/-1/0/0/-1/1/1/0/211
MSVVHQLKLSKRQLKNPVLSFFSQIKYAIDEEMEEDFIMGEKGYAVGIFLSSKFHQLHPSFIYDRLSPKYKKFKRRILIFLVNDRKDVKDDALLELNRICFKLEFSLFPCFSNQECAILIETFCLNESAKLSVIKEQKSKDYLENITEAFRNIKIDKANVKSLLRNYSSLKNISTASMDEMILIPGLGEKKVKQIHELFNLNLEPRRFESR